MQVWVLWAFLGTLGGIVLMRLLTGRINTRGLLSDPDNPVISVNKVQMLAATGYVALNYLGKLDTLTDFHCLPDVDANMLALLGGSQAFYLGGKGASLLNWLNFGK